MTNFTYETDYTMNTLIITVEGYWDVDLSDEWITWGDFEEYEQVQDNTIEDYVEKTFGHIYSKENRMVAKLAGFDIEYEWHQYDNQKLVVAIGIEPRDDETDIDDHPEFIQSIINSLDIDQEPWVGVQEDQFDWWLENGVSAEDEYQAPKMLEAGYVFVESTYGWYDNFVPLHTATQKQVDDYIAHQIDEWGLQDDADWLAEVKEALTSANFEFNFMLEETA